jgi:hypothetical protein
MFETRIPWPDSSRRRKLGKGENHGKKCFFMNDFNIVFLNNDNNLNISQPLCLEEDIEWTVNEAFLYLSLLSFFCFKCVLFKMII